MKFSWDYRQRMHHAYIQKVSLLSWPSLTPIQNAHRLRQSWIWPKSLQQKWTLEGCSPDLWLSLFDSTPLRFIDYSYWECWTVKKSFTKYTALLQGLCHQMVKTKGILEMESPPNSASEKSLTCREWLSLLGQSRMFRGDDIIHFLFHSYLSLLLPRNGGIG